MANHSPMTADTRYKFEATIYLWLFMGFFLGLVVELAVLGFAGLMNASLELVFMIPLAVGAACMGMIWAVHRVFGRSGVVLANWSVRGMYMGIVVASLVLRLFTLWKFTMLIVLAGMVSGLIVGLLLGLVRVRAGARKVFR